MGQNLSLQVGDPQDGFSADFRMERFKYGGFFSALIFFSSSFPRWLLWFRPLHRCAPGLPMTISHLLCKPVTQCAALELDTCGFASLEEFSKAHTSCQQKVS